VIFSLRELEITMKHVCEIFFLCFCSNIWPCSFLYTKDHVLNVDIWMKGSHLESLMDFVPELHPSTVTVWTDLRFFVRKSSSLFQHAFALYSICCWVASFEGACERERWMILSIPSTFEMKTAVENGAEPFFETWNVAHRLVCYLKFLFLWFYSIYSTISSVLLWKSLRLFHKVVFGVFNNLSLTMEEMDSFTQNSVRWDNWPPHKIHGKGSSLLMAYAPVEICEKESLLYYHETSQNLTFYLFRWFSCKIGTIHTLK
jgi:hypothetical protein